MSDIFSQLTQFVKASYDPIPDYDAKTGPAELVKNTEPEPTRAYTVELACSYDLFRRSVMSNVTFKLKKSEAEPAIAQWSEQPHGQHTYLSFAVREAEPKSLHVGWHSSHTDIITLDDVVPHEKNTVSVKEAFVPVRPAIQIGEQLGLPTEGYLYYFLDGELLHEYRCKGGTIPRFQVTMSRRGAMNPQPVNDTSVDFILALWQRGGLVIEDQYLLYCRSPLGNNEIASVDRAFLEKHGVKLDMRKIIPLTEQKGQRQSHVIASGDTLTSIAEQYQTSVDALLALNPQWRGKERMLEVGAVLYLEAVGTYNHGADVVYPATSMLLDEGVFAIGHITKKAEFPVIRVAKSTSSRFTALSPVRYAIDTVDEEGRGLHPISDTQTFPGGIFQSEQTPYTLRQIRDGWLYMLSQDPETKTWDVGEFLIKYGEFSYVAGHTVAEREKAKMQPTKAHILCAADRPVFLAYSVKRWTQRVQDYYLGNEDARKLAMREVDWSKQTHMADVALIEDYLADMNSNPVFDWSSAFQDPKAKYSDFTTVITPKTVKDFRYQLPMACNQLMIALDDPFGDLSDLYLKLLMPTLVTTLSDEDQRKTLIAESIRSLVRVSIPEDAIPEIAPKDWIDFERAVDVYLEYHYYQERLSNADHALEAKAALSFEAERNRLIYPEARATLARFGVDEALIKSYQEAYTDRRSAYLEVDWDRLDAYYISFVENQAVAHQDIERAFPILIDAFHTLGTEPLHLGIDLAAPEHMGYLIQLISEMLEVLNINCQQRKEAEEKMLNALVQEKPDNLLALIPTFFSHEVYIELDKLLSEFSLSEFTKGSHVAFGGVMSAFNDVIGFSLDKDSKILKFTQGLLLPLDVLVESAKSATVNLTAKGAGQLFQHFYTTACLLLRSKSLIASRNAAMATWAAQKIAEGEIEMNGRFSEETRRLQQKFNDLAKEYLDLEEGLKKQTEGSKNYRQTSKRMAKIAKKLAKLVKKSPLLFKAYKQHTGETWVFDASKSNSEKFSNIGRMDFVAATLNSFNLLIQVETLVAMHANTPYPNTKLQDQTVAYSTAWLVNSTGAMLKGLSLNKLQAESHLLDHSLKYINSEKSMWKFSDAQRKLANQYIQRSMVAAVAGVFAAGLEAWQTIETYNKSDFVEEKVVLGLKTLVLAGQGANWLALRIISHLTKVSTRIAIGGVLQGWMVAANFWLGLAYLAITVYQLFYSKSPMENWLRGSIWGKEPNADWTAEKEYSELLTLINQPSIQPSLVSRNVQTLRSDSAATVLVESEQKFTLFFPHLQEGDSIGLAVNVGYGNLNGMAKIDTTNSRHLSIEELQSGRWEKKAEGLYYHVKLPFVLKQYVNYYSEPLSEIVQVFVVCMEENPYEENNNLSSIYQFQFAPGDSPKTEMAKLKALSPSQHLTAPIEVFIE
ncbi:LysM peptidoglycan-binding domain-containing protein [Photobacterium galatheae]|nr:LysM peptidoglycan-binding domain-containing protein [Photobacterium galatheae]MCM0151604.1 LysM peptidoglycan-binding domain-containing protein [Photobacterium galatheae]